VGRRPTFGILFPQGVGTLGPPLIQISNRMIAQDERPNHGVVDGDEKKENLKCKSWIYPLSRRGEAKELSGGGQRNEKDGGQMGGRGRKRGEVSTNHPGAKDCKFTMLLISRGKKRGREGFADAKETACGLQNAKLPNEVKKRGGF